MAVGAWRRRDPECATRRDGRIRMVRDGLFSFRCVCRLELERSGCVRRGPPAGAGAPPSGGRYGRARKGVRRAPPANVEQRVPPLGWARARSLPRALRALAPTRPAVHYFTVSVHHQFRYSFAQITRRNHLATHVFTRHRRSTLRKPRHWSAPQSNHVQTRTSSASRQARAIPTRTWCRR